MTILETSIKIGKPVEKVFEYLTNPSLESMKKMSEYVTGLEVEVPLNLGSKYKITTTSFGKSITSTNEIVAFEKNKLLSTKTFAAPPAFDVTNTYILEKDGSGTKLIMQMDTVLVPPGMPNMPGMEDIMKKQMMASFEATLATLKKAIEG